MGFEFHEGFGQQDPASPITPTDVQDFTKNWDALGYNRFDGISQGIKNESFTFQAGETAFDWASDKITDVDSRNVADANFSSLDEEWMNKLDTLSPDALKLFNQYGAQNADYAEIAFKDAQNWDLDQEYLQSLGLEGTGYRLLGALTDLPLVLATAPESGGGSLVSYGARMARILNTTFTRRVLTGATIEGLMEVGRQNLSKESRDEWDLILAVGLGGLSRGLFAKHPDHELARISRELLTDASKGIDVGARLAKMRQDANDLDLGETANAAIEKLQYDLASQSAQSASPTFRQFADKMYYQRTGTGSLDREPGKMAGEETKDYLEQHFYNMVTTATRPLMTDIAKMSKRGVFKELRAHWDPRFQATVNEVMGDLQLGKLFNPENSADTLKSAVDRLVKDLGLSADEALTVAKRMSKVTEDISEQSHDILRQAGSEMFQSVDGIPGIPKSKDYMPINHDSFKVADLVKSHGQKEMLKFFEKSISSAIKKRGMKLNSAKTRAVAQALLKRMSSTDEMSFITKMDSGDLRDLLTKNGIDDADADYISTLLSKSDNSESAGLGLSKHEKTRGIFDYAIRHTTDDGATIGFKDMISNNFEGAWFPYGRAQAGANTLEKMGLKSDEARKVSRAKIKEELDAAELAGEITPGQVVRELNRYDDTILELQGKPLANFNPFGKGAQALRTAKNMNIARYLGQTFWTMSAELGSTVWNTGMVHMIKSVPMMGQLRKQFVNGKFDDELMQEIYTHLGLMGDLNRGIGFSKYEHDFANITSGGIGSKMDKLEEVSEKFREAALMVGGIKPLTAYFEAATSSGLITKMLKAAHGKRIPKGFETTLGEMGFTGSLRKDIFEQILKHTKTTESKIFGKGLKKINLEEWDPEIRDAFIIGVKRHTNTIVQRSTMGDKVGVMVGDKLMQNTWQGKLGLEMKGYVINSWSKQLGRALTRRDLYSLGMLTTQMTLGAMAYMAQTYTNYPNDPKKRAELLTPERIAKATFARSSMASWLPQLIDTGAQTGLYEKQFSHARSSGLASGLVAGMPVVDLIDTASSAFKLPAAALGIGDVKPGELKNAFRLLPLHTALGNRALYESVVRSYKDGREEDRMRGY